MMILLCDFYRRGLGAAWPCTCMMRWRMDEEDGRRALLLHRYYFCDGSLTPLLAGREMGPISARRGRMNGTMWTLLLSLPSPSSSSIRIGVGGESGSGV
jgi:hypothetical protein